ncbi:MAG: hypothetical protein NTV30_08140, partial [Chloroflexi bacterium]|nr:hypothetical protein [Chloroflexota bacterium]
PFYSDLAAMPEDERRVIWGVMIGEESKTKITYELYKQAGFDPTKHLLQGYQYLKAAPYGLGPVGQGSYLSSITGGNVRSLGPGITGGLVIDWNLKTNLEGLYSAGDCVFASYGHCQAATNGKYAGRNAAEYVKKVSSFPRISRQQIEEEKLRIYAATERKTGVDWKELNHGLNKIMQVYCGDPKSEKLMKIGLQLLDDLKKEAAFNLYANNPHKLSRCLETMDSIVYSEAIIYGCMARKSSSNFLDFYRYDYPQLDSPEWRKNITLKKVDDEIQYGELSLGFWGDYKKNYEANSAR